MPRRSKAAEALTLVHVGPDRLQPPGELGEQEAAVFRQAVAAVPAGHFAAEDIPLLCAYSRAAVLERRAAEELAVVATVGNAPSPWLTVHTQTARTLMALSVRLRIGPRSRAPSNNRRSARSGTASLSYYETMDLQGGVDAEDRPRSSGAGAGDAEG